MELFEIVCSRLELGASHTVPTLTRAQGLNLRNRFYKWRKDYDGSNLSVSPRLVEAISVSVYQNKVVFQAGSESDALLLKSLNEDTPHVTNSEG